jgi:hypothetical protein
MPITLNGTSGVTTPAIQTGGVAVDLYPLVSGTAQASTSGTSIDFTGIPSWVDRVTVMFSGVSTNGTSEVTLQLGTSGGFVTSGYLGTALTVTTGGTTGTSNLSSGFLVRMGTTAGTAAAVRHGHAVFTLLGSNTWVCSLNIGLSNNEYLATTAGSIALGGALTQVRVTTAGGANTFDAGTINILYE